ncbi:ABC transporter permease [Mycoplasma crocodyli]|uniref:ABC transporter permease n=1 Tax=Mycoplasma crocodyli TaxID=50052 RepID=UPI0002FE30AB|nr:ABC transporter permease [Mycoplasma crocodyli]
MKDQIKTFNDKVSGFLNKAVHNYKSEEKGYARRRMYNSLWAIFFGLLISSIFIIFLKQNPFTVFSTMLTKSVFADFKSIRDLFAINFVIFIIATLGISIGFKAGLFNIGIPGQMMTGGIISLVIILTFQSNGIEINFWIFMLALIVSLVTCFLLGAFVGLLKSFLNVHEVVSTILLNWIILYIATFLFTNSPAGFGKPDNTGSFRIEIKDIANSMFNYDRIWPLFLVIALALCVTVWFVLSKTTIGYRIKMNGLNKNVSKYAGSNEKVLTITLMGVSSTLAGFAGVIYYVIFKQEYNIIGQPLLMGFNTIPISLLAYNSPIGLIFSSILFSIMESANLQGLGITNESTQVISGLIVYLAALSNIFFNFKVVEFSIKYIKLFMLKKYWERRYHYYSFKAKRKKLYKKDLANAKLEIKAKASQIKELKNKLTKLNNGISFNLSIKDVKTNEDSLRYFSDISTNKKDVQNKLIELNYYKADEIKMTYLADLKIAKDTYDKEVLDILTWLNNLRNELKVNIKNAKNEVNDLKAKKLEKDNQVKKVTNSKNSKNIESNNLEVEKLNHEISELKVLIIEKEKIANKNILDLKANYKKTLQEENKKATQELLIAKQNNKKSTQTNIGGN